MIWTRDPRHDWASTSSSTTLATRLRGAGYSARGRAHSINEDCFKVNDRLGLLLVADGMGGHRGGGVASHLVADAIVDYLEDPQTGIDRWPYGFDASLSEDGNRLRTAIHASHIRLLESCLVTPGLSSMGTTVVAALEHGGQLAVAWVGDSRLYLCGSMGLRQLTRDDSWIEAALLEHPDADLETLKRHPLRNALTNVLGTASHLDVHVVDVSLRGDDVVALTSDGIHGVLDERDLTHMLSRQVDPARAAADLVAAAVGVGSSDDCTAVIARF